MISYGKWIVKHKVLVFVLGLMLLIPSFIGYLHTRVNYDILSYLPKDIETMKGQDILVDQFNTGGFSFYIVEGMEDKDVAKLKAKIQKLEHVTNVIWYDSVADLSMPKELLPEDLYDAFCNGDATMMMILFDDTTSADSTMDTIEEIRRISNKQCFLSGMSAVVTDTKLISENETPMYVAIAGGLSLLILSLASDSFLVPVFFLIGIGMAIVYNLGSNVIFGEISYITKALAAVLQLGVTMDYSIFLWNAYTEELKKHQGDYEEAMAHAIASTISSVVGSSVTTVAGFVALVFMTFTLGMDLGIVMAKGVVIGVICCITILPSMIILFRKVLEKTRHRDLLPEFNRVTDFLTKHYIILAILFVLLWIPAIYGNNHVKVYYNLDETIPVSYESRAANVKLNKLFESNSTHMLLVDANLDRKTTHQMIKELQNVDGVKAVLGKETFLGEAIPEELISDSELLNKLQSKDYQLILVTSKYKVASNQVNAQIDEINEIVHRYDNKKSMVIGEAPCTRDLIEITDKDFKRVSAVSMGAIFLIIFFVFKSISLPVILVSVIELAIYINMACSYFMGTRIPFIASVVIGTIQLGATVDYAILMTTRYKRERYNGKNKKEAVKIAAGASAKSIVGSGFSFFAATIGVAVYSKIAMISQLCLMMSRGALISMVVVIIFLPMMFLLFDGLISHTSFGFFPKKRIEEKKDLVLTSNLN